jgi:HK97 family phage prohead protease
MQRAFELKLKSLSEDGTFEGLAAVYSNVDDVGDLLEPGSLTKTLNASTSRTLLWQHRDAIGTVELTDTQTAVVAKGKLTLAVQQAQEAYALMKDGAVKGLSIGYETLKADYVGTVRHLREIKLWEVSLVWAPANPLATITAVKSADLTRISVALDEFKSALFYALERK